MNEVPEIAFGPVPSRRLGRSLGINNIPPKLCSYSCVYCQLGRTLSYSAERRKFYDSESIKDAVSKKIREAEERGERIDYLTFVPDGEPTLDANLGKEIRDVKDFGIKVAVISNSSLIWSEDVRNDLMESDWVSLKVDSTEPGTWVRVDRPKGSVKLEKVLDGIRIFASEYKGYLATETMLVDGIQDEDDVAGISKFIRDVPGVKKSYLAVPTRPPAEKWVRPPDENFINLAFQVFSKYLGQEKVEYLIGYEGNEFSITGNVLDSILDTTSVHPMRRDAIEKALRENGSGWDEFEKLVKEGRMVELEYEGKTYFMRKIQTR